MTFTQLIEYCMMLPLLFFFVSPEIRSLWLGLAAAIIVALIGLFFIS
jgi:hypothetical protein